MAKEQLPPEGRAAVDPHSGSVVDAFLGGDSHPDDEFDPAKLDRGDGFVAGEDEKAPAKPTAEKKEEPAEEETESEESEETKPEDTESEETEEEAAEETEEEEAPEETEEKPPAKKDDKQPPGKKPKVVPYDRFKEVNDAKRVAQERLAQLEAQNGARDAAKKGEYDFDAKEREYVDLVLEGKKDEAIALRKEIRAAEAELYQRTATDAADQAFARGTAKMSVEEIVEQAAQDFPVFDPDSDEFNDELASDVEAQFQGYVAQKMKPADAIRKAIANVVKLNDLTKAGDESTEETTEETEEKPEDKKPAKPKPAEKPITKLKQKVAAAKKQPPSTAGAGTGSASGGASNINVNELSEEEFDALPDSTKQRIRGDSLGA